MEQFRKRSMAATVGAGAAVASVSGAGVALVAAAASASAGTALAVVGQDINNDWGQTPEEVAAEIRAQVAADPAVVDARARYVKALHVVDLRKADVKDAVRAYKRALNTKSRLDDRRAKRNLADARQALQKALDAASRAKTAWEAARAEATARITALHYVLDPNPTPTPTPTSTSTTPTLINGTFLGLANNTNPYGTMQVQITVVDSIITAVTTPVYPTESDSKEINERALPILQNEAVVAQSSNIASVSGASYSSPAFKESLQSAIVLSGLAG
jgi:uncharacterized protein with FMN-binding domain